MPFLSQLQEMFLRPNFFISLQHRFQRPIIPNIISDIYDGNLYRHWFNNGFLNNINNISLSWYTDGIPVFKSSHVSIWPVYLTINELPFKDRKKRQNTLLVGFWYGSQKPNMNIVIHKFRAQIEKLFNGIEVVLPNGNTITVRGVILMGTCDLPAKCQCLNMMQYNGEYGCCICLCKGITYQLGPNSHVHVYPYEKEIT